MDRDFNWEWNDTTDPTNVFEFEDKLGVGFASAFPVVHCPFRAFHFSLPFCSVRHHC